MVWRSVFKMAQNSLAEGVFGMSSLPTPPVFGAHYVEAVVQRRIMKTQN